MKDNIIKEKSYQFSLDSIRIYKLLTFDKKEFILSKQFLRSATSIGANIEEGLAGHSKKDFIARFQISYKEAKEVHYWIRLLKDSGYLDEEMATGLLINAEEIIRILNAILKSSKQVQSP